MRSRRASIIGAVLWIGLPLLILDIPADAEPGRCALQYGQRLILSGVDLQLTVYESEGVRVAILESTVPYLPRSLQPIYRICDVLALPKHSDDEIIVGGSTRHGLCRCGDSVRREYIALARWDGRSKHLLIDHVWKIDAATLRFEAVPQAGISCSPPTAPAD
jgi:hypothetical protein